MLCNHKFISSLIISSLALTCAGYAESNAESKTENAIKEENYQAIIEYMDKGKITDRRVYNSSVPYKSGTGISISLPDTQLILYGISSCPSDVLINAYVFKGPCSNAARQYLDTELSISHKLTCRAYLSQANQPYQSVTCQTQSWLLGTEITHNLEDLLVRTGTAYVTRNDKGELLRQDLASSENQARAKKTIIWSPEAAEAWGK
ncbi:hypothetical protein [Bartonella choladocola]|uniref:Endonuclease YncB, thermonuclease family n=2 Tax=Bartonella choladocola TaxID=2750995 RepID=A0A1U9MJW5_9HYPH|nr:hypothetical protein [Bartonella choladocola]AQT48009.1 hypothetical protein BBC0122_019150 [Bartonella choladocola]